MTALETEEDQLLYVNPSTLDELIISGRVGIRDRRGPVRLTFSSTNPDHPGKPVAIADDVEPGAIHRRRFKLTLRRRPFFERVGAL